jgi:hypothetical protein
MIKLSHPIVDQHDLTTLLRQAQPAIIRASKDTLHNKHYINLSVKNKGVVIKKAPTSAHKQLFALLLKITWEEQDLTLISGYCAIIRLINLAADKPYTVEDNLTLIHLICDDAWRAAYMIPNDESKSQHVTVFNIFNIEAIQTIICPLDYVEQLPDQISLHTSSEGLSRFFLKGMQYHANHMFKYHIDDEDALMRNIEIGGNAYIVHTSAYGTSTHNVFELFSKSIINTNHELATQSDFPACV